MYVLHKDLCAQSVPPYRRHCLSGVSSLRIVLSSNKDPGHCQVTSTNRPPEGDPRSPGRSDSDTVGDPTPETTRET